MIPLRNNHHFLSICCLGYITAIFVVCIFRHPYVTAPCKNVAKNAYSQAKKGQNQLPKANVPKMFPRKPQENLLGDRFLRIFA